MATSRPFGVLYLQKIVMCYPCLTPDTLFYINALAIMLDLQDSDQK